MLLQATDFSQLGSFKLNLKNDFILGVQSFKTESVLP